MTSDQEVQILSRHESNEKLAKTFRINFVRTLEIS